MAYLDDTSPTIHTLGNVGLGGALHAALAPLSTKLIDVVAYEGQDVRQKVRHPKKEMFHR